MASRLFHERGYGATGVATILREAGVNSGSLYHFFPGKEALLVGVMERHLDTLLPSLLGTAEAATEDPLGRVFALLDSYRRDLLISGCTRGCPVGNLALEVGDEKPRVRELIEEYFSRWTEGVRGWLEAAGGRLPSELDRGELSRFVLAVMEGAVMQARAAGSLDPFDASVLRLRDYMQLLGEATARGRVAPPIVHAGMSPDEPAESVEPDEATGWRAW